MEASQKELLAQLADLRTQRAQLTGLKAREMQLLLDYAAAHRLYADGLAIVWRQRPCLIAGAVGYFAADGHTVLVVYGAMLCDGTAYDSVREDNIVLA